MTGITATLHWDICTFVIRCRWIVLTIKVSGKICSEDRSTHFVSNYVCENRTFMKNVWKYGTARQVTDGNAIIGQVIQPSQI